MSQNLKKKNFQPVACDDMSWNELNKTTTVQPKKD